MSDYYVEIRNSDSDKVVKRMGPMSARKANKVKNGVWVNLDHEHYYTEITLKEQF